jgi:hypothetical protein
MPPRQSHYELPGDFDVNNPQEMMAQRLRELHELHELQDNVQGLLKDPEFLDKIKKNFSEQQLQQLREKIAKREGLGQDDNWNQLLQKAGEGRKLDEKQIEILKRWAERTQPKSTPTLTEHHLMNGHSPSSPPPNFESGAKADPFQPSSSPTSPPEPSFFDHVQEETTKWVTNNMEDVGGDLLEALAEMDGNRQDGFLAELVRNIRQPDLPTGDFLPESGFPEFMPNVGEYFRDKSGILDETGSLFKKVPSPTLPNFGDTALSMQPSSSPVGSGSLAPVFLTFLLIGLTVFLAWKLSLGQKSSESGESEHWRLGSWPVAPGNVTTRQDVVRAFEYLALLCLGVSANTCHHHELAERLAGQDQDNSGRRQAAETLAWLYEQARYAPPSEMLSSGELTDARHALCLLAGEGAA